MRVYLEWDLLLKFKQVQMANSSEPLAWEVHWQWVKTIRVTPL